MLFRIEDIRRLRLVRKEPKAGFGSEQFDAAETPAVRPDSSPVADPADIEKESTD